MIEDEAIEPSAESLVEFLQWHGVDARAVTLNGSADGSPRARLRTDVEFREGQKAIIGSSTPEGVGETLILIVEAKIVGKES